MPYAGGKLLDKCFLVQHNTVFILFFFKYKQSSLRKPGIGSPRCYSPFHGLLCHILSLFIDILTIPTQVTNGSLRLYPYYAKFSCLKPCVLHSNLPARPKPLDFVILIYSCFFFTCPINFSLFFKLCHLKLTIAQHFTLNPALQPTEPRRLML